MGQNVAVIICAAGASSRFGQKKKKPFVDLGGRAVFMRSIEVFANREDVKQILLAISPEDEEMVTIKWGPNLKFYNVAVCFGGRRRFETVKSALELVKDDIDIVAVHDAVRCCVSREWIDAVLGVASETGAAILACPVVATLKQVADKRIVKTVDRDGLYEAQTPQVFKTDLLRKAYAKASNLKEGTIGDDSQLVEALGMKVSVVETDSSNVKITKAADIAIAEAILKSRPKARPKGPTGPYVEAQW